MARSPGLVFRIRSDSGMSLVEVLVCIGILAVVISGMSSYMASSSREVRALTETLAKLDTEKLLIASLADGVACSAELASPSVWTAGAQPYTIDSTNPATLAATSIKLDKMHASAAANAPVLIAKGAAPSPMANGLVVNGITVGNFQATGAPDIYLADLTVSFTGSVRSPSPIVLRKNIATVSTGPNTKKITGCLSANGPSSVGGLIKLSDYPAVFGGQRTVNFLVPGGGMLGPGGSFYYRVTTNGLLQSCNASTGACTGACNIFTTGNCGGYYGADRSLTSSGVQQFTPANPGDLFMGVKPTNGSTVLYPWQ